MATRQYLATLLGAVLSGCAALAPMPTPLVPAGETARLTLAARGVQIYECRRAEPAAAPAWAFVAPDAQLFDAHGAPFGSHGAGPFWQAADGSRIVGSVVAKVDAPRADAIPWLLLRARPAAGAGTLTRVSSVQRIHTEGGLAPGDGCADASLGGMARVPYRADYVFFESGTRY